jgi:hypothetical protein
MFKFLSYLSILLVLGGVYKASSTIIDQALQIELPITNTIIYEESLKFKKQAYKKLEEANYEKALEIILEGLKNFPKSFTLQTYFAALVGDLSEKYTTPLREDMTKKSKKVFNKLMNEVEGQQKREVYRFKNEYYFRFALYEKQYQLGLQMVEDYWNTKAWISEDGLSGYYYQGVGAAYLAKELLIKGNKPLAIEYAQKSLVSWAQYFSYENNYYNAYVHYALTLGILGQKQEMLKALEHGASLIKQDLHYHEFKEVIEFIEKIK